MQQLQTREWPNQCLTSYMWLSYFEFHCCLLTCPSHGFLQVNVAGCLRSHDDRLKTIVDKEHLRTFGKWRSTSAITIWPQNVFSVDAQAGRAERRNQMLYVCTCHMQARDEIMTLHRKWKHGICRFMQRSLSICLMQINLIFRTCLSAVCAAGETNDSNHEGKSHGVLDWVLRHWRELPQHHEQVSVYDR